MPFTPFLNFSLRQRNRRSSATSDSDHSRGPTVVSRSDWHIDTPDDISMNTIETLLAILKESSSLASKLPFIAPIAGLLLQALTTRNEVKQYKSECEIVMYKLARIAEVIVGVGELCETHNLREEDLPAGLRAILGSLQKTRVLDRIERVLKKCSKRKGMKGFLLRKDLLTKIKQCDLEISNVLQAFQAELSLDTRVALVAMRREVASGSGPTEATPIIPQEPKTLANTAQILLGSKVVLDALWRVTLNAKITQPCTIFLYFF